MRGTYDRMICRMRAKFSPRVFRRVGNKLITEKGPQFGGYSRTLLNSMTRGFA